MATATKTRERSIVFSGPMVKAILEKSHPSIDAISMGYGFEDFSRSYFAQVWDELNGPRGFPWSSNPWVWVIGFRRVKP